MYNISTVDLTGVYGMDRVLVKAYSQKTREVNEGTGEECRKWQMGQEKYRKWQLGQEKYNFCAPLGTFTFNTQATCDRNVTFILAW